jgi:ATP-dependent exoDNAse (exonuclease V) beta subunit
MVFGHLDHVTSGEKCRDGLRAWHGRFTKHKTAKTDAPGYVCLHTGPAMTDGQSLDAHRISHCRFVAEQIGELAVRARGRSIGVLCRKNDTVARMIYELRRRNVAASEEGGSALTDSAAVEVILSLFALADHPGDSVARFHLLHSPLRPQLETSLADPDALAERFRGELLADGYGPFTYRWAKALAPACDARDLRRLQQLVETAYAFQPRSTLRPGAFAAWVRGQRVADPSGAGVRVLTIHAAKGLEFDAVVLPELDTRLLSQPPAFVIGRDPHSLAPTFVCRYADEALQALMTADEQSAFAQERCRRVEESLSLLYVAMTRAAHALYLYVPGPRKPETGDTWCRLLLQRLAPDQEPTGGSLLTQDGHADWAELLRQPAPSVSVAAFDPPRPIVFRPPPAERRRGLEHVTPSRREGQGRVLLRGLIHPSEGTGTAAGMIYHAWFEAISWLDDGPPTDDELYTAAERKRWDVPVEIWNERVRLLAMFRTWLKNPAITAVFRRSSYAGPRQPGFPKGLAPYWTETTLPKKVERERRFLVRDGTQLWSGSLDRVVWLADGDRTVAADILDFKTDAIAPGDMAALTERIECYRPQLEAYRGAVALLAKLPPDRVSARLVFPMAGEVVPV